VTRIAVRQLMVADFVRVPPDMLILDVMREMNRLRIGAVLVVGPGDSLEGVFTERDLLRRVPDEPPGWRKRPVADWMTRQPYTIGPDASWEEALALMERLRVRHLPVVERGRVVGIVSSRLLMSQRAAYLDRLVEDRTAELRRANELLLSRDRETRANMRAAGQLQQRLVLPGSPPDWPELGWGVHFAPLDPLGGDYYDFARPAGDRLGVLIADASGHSIPAALVAVMARLAFAEVAQTTASPGEVLAAMNRLLTGLVEERFVTAFYGVLERGSGAFTYACAGHPPPLRYAAGRREVEPLAGRGFMLGVVPGAAYDERTVALDPGDRLCLYTDGAVECRNPAGEMFGSDRLADALAAGARRPAPALADDLAAGVRAFAGGRPVGDDLTLLVADLRGTRE
jgi:sigma-B regulation protein RsbU (phosphoserine phosphatase)